ncbi:uncharacterized protein LOC125488684 isoform X1 [Plutella xylostella]|uniref:uncharacterized protein LOC125488684 isoform X1 n=1 Tax=Plutella xylostella TaxID=51655 RepID=UPI0020327199|nr:uncharacterized protein LOC125488684 isoform X1 [Plutella xylostella]XP_048477849.1 uncharacterized protein LOC125488684 isoform X1 [Plutella xylostella]
MLFLPVFLILIVEGVIFTVSMNRAPPCHDYEVMNKMGTPIACEKKCSYTPPADCGMPGAGSSYTAVNPCVCPNGMKRAYNGQCVPEATDCDSLTVGVDNVGMCDAFSYLAQDSIYNEMECGAGNGGYTVSNTCYGPNNCCCKYGYLRQNAGSDSGQCIKSADCWTWPGPR